MNRAIIPTLLVLALLTSCGDSTSTAAPDADVGASEDAQDALEDGSGDRDTPGTEPDDGGQRDTTPEVLEEVTSEADVDAEVGDTEAPDAAAVDVSPEVIGPFVCSDDGECEGRVEATPCSRPACVAGHCVVLPDDEGAACDDDAPCTTGSTCQSGECGGGVPLDCSGAGQPPCTLGVCDAAQGGCVSVTEDEGTVCDDGDPCTHDDACLAGACVGVSDCDDGDLCNGVEGCDGDGLCVPGTPLNCQSDNPCLGVPACDPVFGCVLGPPPECGTYACTEGGCETSCEDDAQCIDGTYCAGTACVPDLPNGDPCTAGGMCLSGHCGGAVCCTAGQCCTQDAECPLSGVDVVASQESFDAQSGLARVIITPTTHGLQSFVAQEAGVLERIDLMLQTPAQEGYLLEVHVWAEAPPSPGATEIGKATLLVVAPSSEPTVWTATFEEPIALVEGESYGLSVSWLNGDADCVAPCAVIWLGEEGDPYPDGQVYRTYNAGSEWELSDWNDDLWFRVWAGQHSCEDNMCVDVQP